MLNSGKNINILTLVLSEKKFLKKNHNPPLQVKWSVPSIYSTPNNAMEIVTLKARHPSTRCLFGYTELIRVE